MRVAGDVEQCLRVADALDRAARAAGDGLARVLRARAATPAWSGAAAERWSALAHRQADAGEEVAEGLARAARALRAHATELAELQARAARLTAEAAEAGLHLDDAGHVPPVAVQAGPQTSPDQHAALLLALRRRHLGEALTGRAQALLAEVRQAHEHLARELARELGRTGARVAGSPSPLLPTWWDLPPLALDGTGSATTVFGAASRLPAAVVRGVGRGVPVLGFGYGTWVDVTQNPHMSDTEAVVKNVAVTAAGGAAVAGASALGAPVVLAAGVGVVLGVGVGAVWDLATHDEPRLRVHRVHRVHRVQRTRPATPTPAAPTPTPATPTPAAPTPARTPTARPAPPRAPAARPGP